MGHLEQHWEVAVGPVALLAVAAYCQQNCSRRPDRLQALQHSEAGHPVLELCGPGLPVGSERQQTGKTGCQNKGSITNCMLHAVIAFKRCRKGLAWLHAPAK